MPPETNTPLAGKTVLITGAARRVGAAIARKLHASGANIILHYRSSAAEATNLAGELERARAGSVKTLQADLLDTHQLSSLIGAGLGMFGRLDVLVNNASTFYPTPVGEITITQWDDLIGTNVRAPLFLSQAAAPALRRTAGLILNIVDIHALRPLKEHAVYSTAKAALLMLTKSLARELAPEVRVNGIAPGPVMWPEIPLDDAAKEKIVAQTLLKHLGSADDIARAALFFASEAPYITGQILAVDGGRSVGW